MLLLVKIEIKSQMNREDEINDINSRLFYIVLECTLTELSEISINQLIR